MLPSSWSTRNNLATALHQTGARSKTRWHPWMMLCPYFGVPTIPLRHTI